MKFELTAAMLWCGLATTLVGCSSSDGPAAAGGADAESGGREGGMGAGGGAGAAGMGGGTGMGGGAAGMGGGAAGMGGGAAGMGGGAAGMGGGAAGMGGGAAGAGGATAGGSGCKGIAASVTGATASGAGVSVTIGAFASSGLRSFQWFDANAAGPADFGMITTDKTRPIYYSFVAWSKMGNQVLDVASDTNPHDVAAYATKKSDGSLQVLLINKTDSSHEVALTFNGFSAAGKPLAVYTAGPSNAGSDTATSVTYNGATDPLPSALPAPTASTNADAAPHYTVPAYSLAVLSFGP